jgi:hypothetical protein
MGDPGNPLTPDSTAQVGPPSRPQSASPTLAAYRTGRDPMIVVAAMDRLLNAKRLEGALTLVLH